MRVHGQNYHTNEKGNAKEILESMIRPEVWSIFLFLFFCVFIFIYYIYIYIYIDCL